MKRSESPTIEKLRHKIDRGVTRDKVVSPDPAMAPLGADDEAAGTPITPDRVQIATHEEVHQRPIPTNSPSRDTSLSLKIFSILLVLAGLVVVAVAVS